MALIVRVVSSVGAKTLEKRLKSGLNKLAVPEGGHIEIVDQATGLHVEGVRTIDASGNSVLSFEGPKGPVTLELSGAMGSYSPLFSDLSFAEDTSVVSGLGASAGGQGGGGGPSMTPILLGILGLGALGGIAAAAGGAPKDKTAPGAPSGLDLASADDTGSSNSDNVTSHTTGLTVTGQAEAGARVELFDGATSIGTATADASGNFTVDVALSSGAHSITAKATDASGNIGAASAALSVNVDTAGPSAPTGLDLASADDTGSSVTDNLTSQASGLTITGVAEANAVVELFDGATSLGTVAANGSGSFSLDVTLAAGAHQITAKATDAAGNVGVASTALAVTVDTSAPTPTLLDVDRAAKTLTISFDQSLDLAGILSSGAFSVTTGGGVVNSVSSYAVNGNVVVLTLAGPIGSGTTEITYTDPTASNDAVALQDAAGNDVATFTLSLGVLADGFVRGARIYTEALVNGQVVRTDTGIVTDANGNFFLPPTYAGRTLVAVGGVNIDTGLANTIDYRAPAGSSVINPLTTLIQAVIDASPTPISASSASQSVASALGVTLPYGKALTNYDPISYGNTELQRAAAQVAAIATVADGNASGNEGKVFSNIAAQLVTAARASGTVDLAASQVVTAALVGTTVVGNSALVNQIQTSVTAIENAANISGIASAQATTLDRTAAATPGQIDLIAADDTGTSSSDNITSKRSFSGTVAFNNTATDGTAAVVGDTIEIVVGGRVIASHLVTDADHAAGSATVAFANVQDGAYAASARIVDKAGNLSQLSTALNLTVDGTSPATPTLSFSNLIDTGSVEQARVTTDKAFNIDLTGAENGANVGYEVSTNGGASWSATTASQANLADGNYSFRATLTDAAGNSTSSNILSMTVDTTNPSTPVVTAQTTTSTSPIVGGTAALGVGEILSVTINGAIYENVAVSNGAWSVDTATATPKSGTILGAFVSGSYDVVATITDRAGNVSSDTSAREVTVTPTFSVSESNGVVSFAGTATGAINVSYASGAATFTRSGVSATTTVTSLGTKSIAGAVELNVNVSGAATAGDDIITISAPQATAIRFSGDAGAGLDQLIVNVADKNVGTIENRTILVDTSGMTNAEDIRFAFEATAANNQANRFDNDVLTLASGSVISSGFTVFEVRNGTVDYSSATLPQNISFDFRSGGVSTLAQFQAADSFVSLTDSGSVVIALTSSELPALKAFLASPGALKLIGFNVGLKIDGSSNIVNLSTTTDQNYADIHAALNAISYPGIVGLTNAVADLQSQISANDADITALVNGVAGLTSSIATLNTVVTSKDTAQTAALSSAISAASSDLSSAVATINTRITTVAAGLQANINANSAIDTSQAASLASLRADLTTAQNAATSLSALVNSNNASQTAALNSARSDLAAADSALSAAINKTSSDLASAAQSINGRITTVSAGLQASIDANTVIDTAQAETLAGLRADLTTAQNVASALATTVSSNNTAQAAALASAKATLEAADTTLTNTINGVAADLTSAVSTINGRITTVSAGLQASIDANTVIDTAQAETLAGLRADLTTAQNVASALATTVSSNNTAQTAALNAAKATLETADTALGEAIDAVADRLDTAVAGLQGQIDAVADVNLAQADLLVGLRAELTTAQETAAALADLVDGNDTAIHARVTALAERLDAADTALGLRIDDLASVLNDEISARSEADSLLFNDAADHDGIATTNSIVGLKAALDTLATLVGDNNSDLLDALNSANTHFYSLVDRLPGRGVLMSVDEALVLQDRIDDPLHIFLTNYIVRDSVENLLNVSSGDALIYNAKDVYVSGTVASASAAQHLKDLGVNLALSSYDVSESVANLVSYGSFPAEFLGNARDINASGTANFTQALTLLGAQNRGTTYIDAVKVSYAQAASLPVDLNDVISHLTVTGLDLSNKSTIVDLTGFRVNTDITFAGGRGNETVVITAASTSTNSDDVGIISLNGGKGSDDFYVIESVDGDGNGLTSYLVSGSAISGGSYIGTTDTLTVRGQVDLSRVDISGIEGLYLEEGSPSAVVLRPDQLSVFDTISGATDENGDPVSSIAVVVIDGSTSADISGLPIDFTNTPTLRVGEGVSLTLSLSQIGALGDIVAVDGQDAGQIVPVLGDLSDDVNLTNVFVDLDLSNVQLHVHGNGQLFTNGGDYAVLLPTLASGQTLSLNANDLDGQISLDGDGTLLIKNDFYYNGVGGTFDLTQVTADISFDDNRDGNNSVNVGDGKVLILRPDQADEKTITNSDGNGLVAISGNVHADASIDLRNISAPLTFSDDAGGDPSAINLGSGATLQLNAAQADGQSITGDPETTITFEDAVGSQLDFPLSMGYHGFNWTLAPNPDADNLTAINGDNLGRGGYEVAAQDWGSVVAYTPYGLQPVTITRSDASDFVFTGIQLTAATSDMQITLAGYNNGQLVAERTVSISAVEETTLTFDWGAIDELVICSDSYDGIAHGSHFIIDDFKYATGSPTATVEIYNLEDTPAANFGNISNTLVALNVSDNADFTFTGNLGDAATHDVILGVNAAMSLASGQADGRTITGEDSSSVYVRELTESADLSHLADNIAVTAEVSSVLDLTQNTQVGTVDTFALVAGTNGQHIDLSAYAGKTVDISLNSDLSDDTYLFVFDANGQLVAYDDDTGPGTNSLIETLTVQDGYYAVLSYYLIVDEGASVSDFSGDTLHLEVYDREADETSTLFLDTLQTVTSSLTLTADQANAQNVTGVGDVYVTGLTDDGNGHLTTDLTHITVDGTFTITVSGSVDVRADIENLASVDAIIIGEGYVDLTGAQIIDASSGGDFAEGLGGLFDGIDGQKFFYSYAPGFAAVVHLPEAKAVSSFSLTTGNDDENRDPATVTIRGSNDGVNFVDIVTDMPLNLPSDRISTSDIYSFSNSVSYSYYKVEFPTTKSGPALQLGEMRLFEGMPAVTIDAESANDRIITETSTSTLIVSGSHDASLTGVTVSTLDVRTATGNIAFNQTVSDGHSILLTADQADGEAFGGSGSVYVYGNVSNTTVDITGIGTAIYFDENHISIGESGVLRAKLDQADGVDIDGAGILALTDGVEPSDTTFLLSGVATDIDLTGISSGFEPDINGTLFSGNSGNHISLPSLDVGQDLLITVAQANGLAMESNAGTVNIQGDIGDNTYVVLTRIYDDVDLTFRDSLSDTGVGLVDIGNNSEVTLSAVHADGLHMQGEGAVRVTQLENALEGDFSALIASTVTLVLSDNQSSTFEGTLSDGYNTSFEVGAGAALTLHEGAADGRTVTGTGTLDVLDIQTSTDLSNVEAPFAGITAFTGFGTLDLVLEHDENSTATLDADSQVLTLTDTNLPGTGGAASIASTVVLESGQFRVHYEFDGSAFVNAPGYGGEMSVAIVRGGVTSVVQLNELNGERYSSGAISVTQSTQVGLIGGEITLDLLAGDEVRFIVYNPHLNDGLRQQGKQLTLNDARFFASGNEPLAGLAAVIGHISGSSVDVDGLFDITANSGAGDIQAHVTAYTIEGDYTLRLTAAQADALVVTESDAAFEPLVDVVGDMSADQAVDLRSIAAGISVTFGVDGISLDTGSVLTLTALQASGNDIHGAGMTYVAGDVGAVDVVDLTGVISTLTSFQTNGESTNAISVSGTLKVNAAMLSGVEINQAGSAGQIEIYNLDAVEDSFAFGSVNAPQTITAIIEDDTDLSGNMAAHLAEIDSYKIVEDAGLTLNAAEANAATVTGVGTLKGSVTVKEITDGTNLSGIAGDLNVTATVGGNVDVTGNDYLGTVDKFIINSTPIEYDENPFNFPNPTHVSKVDLSNYAGQHVDILVADAVYDAIRVVARLFRADGTLVESVQYGPVQFSADIQDGDYLIVSNEDNAYGAVFNPHPISVMVTGENEIQTELPVSWTGHDVYLPGDSPSSLTILASQIEGRAIDGHGELLVTGLENNADGVLGVDLSNVKDYLYVVGNFTSNISLLATSAETLGKFDEIRADGGAKSYALDYSDLQSDVWRDAGHDMYDYGNRLSIDGIQQSIWSTDNNTTPTAMLWGDYVFRTFTSSTVLSITNFEGSEFTISGNAGADNGGSRSTRELTGFNGFRVFVDQIYGANGDPSINKLIITNAVNPVMDGTTNTDDDYFSVSGLDDASFVVYVLLAGSPDLDNGYKYTDSELRAVVEALNIGANGITDSAAIDLEPVLSTFGSAPAEVIVDVNTVGDTVLSGSGTIKLVGTGDIDLGNLNNPTVTRLDVSTVVGTVTLPTDIADNKHLVVNDVQANGAVINGNGTLHIAGDITHDVNISDVSAVVSFQDGTETDANAEISIGNGSTLTALLSQVDGQAIAGDGQVVFTGSLDYSVSLTSVTANMDMSGLSGFTVDTETGRLADQSGNTIDLPEELVGDITLTFEQANHLSVTGEGSQTHLIGSYVNLDLDLTGIHNGLVLQYGSLAIDPDFTMTMRADQADGLIIVGDGTLLVSGALLDGTTDLLNATVGAIAFDLSSDGIIDESITIADGQTLKIEGHQLGNVVVTVEGNLDVYLGEGDDDFNIDELIDATTGTVTVHVLGDLDLSSNGNFSEVSHFVVHGDHILTLNAVQADDATIAEEGGHASVHVTDLADAASANLANIVVTSLTAAVDTSFTFDGDLGAAVVTVDPEATLTISAELASGHDISGGNVVITELGTDEYNLSTIHSNMTATVSQSVTLNSATNLGELQISVDPDKSLTLTIDQATYRDISGLGQANVTGDVPDTSGPPYTLDLTGITAPLTFLDPDTQETGLGQIDLGGNSSLLLRADQASGQTVTGDGTVAIDGNVGAGTELEPNIVDLRSIAAGVSFTADDGNTPVGIDVGEYATLQLRDDQASGAIVTGVGAVEVHGLTATTDLSHVGAGVEVIGLSGALAEVNWDTADSQVNAVTAFDAGAGTIHIETPAMTRATIKITPGAGTLSFHSDLTRSAGVNAWLKVNGQYYQNISEGAHDTTFTVSAGDVVEFYVYGNSGITSDILDISNLTFVPVKAETQVSVVISESMDIHTNPNLSTVDTYTIASGQVLGLSAAQANGVATEGGAVNIVGDVASVGNNGLAGGLIDLTRIESALTFDNDDIEVNGYYSRLAIGADQLRYSTVTVSGEGYLVVVGDLTEGTLDLTRHTVSGLSFADTVSSDNVIDVGTSSGLILRTDQAGYQHITGLGTVYVAGDVNEGDYVDLSQIEASISFADDSDAAPSISIAAGGTLYMEAGKLAAGAGTIFGPGTLELTGGVFADTDFSAVDPSVSIDVRDAYVDTFEAITQLGAGSTLTVNSNQVSFFTVTQNLAHIRVYAQPYYDEDLGITILNANLSNLSAASIDMDIEVDLTNIEDLGQTKVHLQYGSVFTLSVALADGVTIDGEGTTNVTGDVAGGTVDLTNVTSTSLTFGGDNAIDVATGATLLVAADAIALADAASPVDITGGGTVELRDANVNASYDFTVVSGPSALVAFNNAGILNAATILHSADGGVSSVSLYDNAATPSVIEVTKMTAAQANGIDFTSSDGALHVTASEGIQSLTGTLHNDVFEGGGTGTDTVNLGADSGSDTLVWATTPANQMVITNFLAEGQGSENDVLDFSNLSLHNPNHVSIYEGLVSDPDVADVPSKLTADVVGLTDLFAGDTAKSVETLFKSSNNFLNKLVDAGTGGNHTDMVFLIANSAADDANINVWHWVDANNDGNLMQNEVLLLGTVNGLGASALTTTNFHDNVIG